MPLRWYNLGEVKQYGFTCACGFSTRIYPNENITKKIFKLHSNKCELARNSTTIDTGSTFVETRKY